MNLIKTLIIQLLCLNLMAQSNEISVYLKNLPLDYKVLIEVKSLDGKTIFNQNENQKVASASTIKVPIMMTVMELVKQKKWSLEDKYSLKNEDKLEGTQLSNMPAGTEYTIRQLVEYMIIYSDNSATNILIKQIGRENINTQIRKWGLTETTLNRIMLDFEAAKSGRENFITCHEANKMLEMIYKNQVANNKLCKEMISILKRNDDRETLPNQIPKNIEIAHKTGTLDWIRGDIGIVFSKKPYFISIFVKKENGQNIELKNAEKIISDISKICFDNLK
jgi:beta-lactamase class A